MIKQPKTAFLFAFLLSILCCNNSQLPMFSVMTTYPIEDLTKFSQSAHGLIVPPSLLSSSTLIQLRAKTKKRFYAPWHHAPCQQGKEAFVENSRKLAYSGFAENLLPHTQTWGDQVFNNINEELYGSFCLPGIVTTTTDLRGLPIQTPHFDDPSTAGNGYPFDNLQESQSPIGTPIWIYHYSKDRAWAYVQTNEQIQGWVKANNIAQITKEQIAELESLPLAVMKKDQTPIYFPNGEFAFYSHLGSYFPLEREDSDRVSIRIPVRLHDGHISFISTQIPKQTISSHFFDFIESDIRFGIEQLIGKPYGWGTYLENRDCSALVHDFYALFGLWLPRNSKWQAATFGKQINLSGKSNEEKQALLHQHGIPYLTLLHKPGHIAIYIGVQKGNSLIFHAPWGVATRQEEKTGRNIIGKSAITTLEFGKEVPNFDRKGGTFLEKMDQLIVLHPEPGPLL